MCVLCVRVLLHLWWGSEEARSKKGNSYFVDLDITVNDPTPRQGGDPFGVFHVWLRRHLVSGGLPMIFPAFGVRTDVEAGEWIPI